MIHRMLTAYISVTCIILYIILTSGKLTKLNIFKENPNVY